MSNELAVATEIARQIAEARKELAADNARARQVAVDRLESELRRFICQEGIWEPIGGVHNLLVTIAQICSEESKLEGDDWETAAAAIDECADACDLKYEVE